MTNKRDREDQKIKEFLLVSTFPITAVLVHIIIALASLFYFISIKARVMMVFSSGYFCFMMFITGEWWRLRKKVNRDK